MPKFCQICYFSTFSCHERSTRSSADIMHIKEIQGAGVGIGGLEVLCSTRDPRFAGSNPAEVDDFFQDVKILSPPGGTLSWGSRVWDFRLVKEPQAWKKKGLWTKFNRHIYVLVTNTIPIVPSCYLIFLMSLIKLFSRF